MDGSEGRVRVNEDGWETAEPGSFFVLNRVWQDGDKVHLSLPMKPRLTRWHHQSAAVEYGPLLMALPVDGEQPLWQLAISQSEGMNASITEKDGGEQLHVSAVFRKVPEWRSKGDRLSMPPIRPELEGEALTLHLTPYGETVCRMAQFPVAAED